MKVQKAFQRIYSHILSANISTVSITNNLFSFSPLLLIDANIIFSQYHVATQFE